MILNRERNISWRDYRDSFIYENKWRSMRHGIEGKMIDLGLTKELSSKKLIKEMIELVDESAEILGTKKGLVV